MPPIAPTLNSDEELSQIEPHNLTLGPSVGTGGTAEVFRGSYFGRVVAIKQLFRHRRMSVKEEISFNREVAVLARITHPNLVQFYGVSFKERPFRIITEFCEGGTAFDLLHNSELVLTWKQKCYMCRDTAAGMEYLHTFVPQIIHRDLKSLNLLMDSQVRHRTDVPVVKVSDFGLSKMKDGPGKSWGKMTSQVGTLHWMAPEVFAGQDYDETVDIYSYAMVMFEILCQEVPFEDTDPSLIGAMTVKGIRPDLSRLPRDCPKQLAEIMMTCWSHDATKRPGFCVIVETLRFEGMIPTPPAVPPPHHSPKARNGREHASVSL